MSGNHLFNQQSSPEQLMNQSIAASSNVEFTFRKNDKAQTIYTDIIFKTNEDSLEVQNTNLLVPDFSPILNEDFSQLLTTKKFEVHSYSSFYSKKGFYTQSTTTGIRYSSQALESTLLTSTEPLSSTTNLFENDYVLKEWKPYIHQSYKIESDNAQWQLHLPLQYYYFDLNDQVRNTERTDHFLLFDVSLEHQRLMARNHNLSIDYTYSHNYDDFENYFYEGYILTSNRNPTRLAQQINRYERHSFSLFLDRNNVLKGIYYKIGTSYERNKYDLLESVSLFDESTIINLEVNEQTRHSVSIDALLSGQLNDKMDFSVAMDYSYNNRPLQINEAFSRVNYTSLFAKVQLSYVFEKSVLALHSTLLTQSSSLFPNSSNQLSMRLVYFLKSEQLGEVKLSYEPYLILSNNVSRWNHLLRLKMNHTIQPKNIELSLQLLNLINTPFFNSFEQNTYFSNFSATQLRPLQVQFSAAKKF